jgi:hypothetical protein
MYGILTYVEIIERLPLALCKRKYEYSSGVRKRLYSRKGPRHLFAVTFQSVRHRLAQRRPTAQWTDFSIGYQTGFLHHENYYQNPTTKGLPGKRID